MPDPPIHPNEDYPANRPAKPAPNQRRARTDYNAGGGSGYGSRAAENGSGYGKGYGSEPSYGYGYGYGQDPAKTLLNRSLRDYIHWYLRHFWVLGITGLLGLFYGFYDYSITPPVYHSSAVIEVKRLQREAADIDEESKLQLGGAGAIADLVEKLQMPTIYDSVARSNLFTNRTEAIPRHKEWVTPWRAFSKTDKSGEEKTDATVSPQHLAGMMRSWITVRWRTQTTLVDLSAKHTVPEVARDTLQSLLIEYERLSQENIGISESYTFEYILEQSDEVKNRILNIEKSLNRYSQCVDLNTKIAQAEQNLLQLETRYLERWPKIIEAKQLLIILKERFSQELAKVLDASPEEQQFWEANFTVAQNSPNDELIDAQQKTVDARFNLLKKELQTEETILQNLTMKLKEGDVSRGFLAKQFVVVQPPTLPGWASEPNQNAILKKFTIFGLGIGILVVFVLGLLDPSIRTVADLEALTAVPVVGALPLKRGEKRTANQKAQRDLVLVDSPNSQQSESIRTLRAGLTYLGDNTERKTFLVTSALASEGKSWVAANLAVAFAHQGDRTLIIDADLRRAVLHNIFDTPAKQAGLSDLLTRKVGFKDAIRPTSIKNLYFLSAGTRSPNPAEMLSSRNLEALMSRLETSFDRIIIDSAPLVLVSDSLSIAKLVQSVLVVYHIGKTPRRALFRALKYLDANHSSPAGLIANQLPSTKTRRAYGYYYSFSSGGGYDGAYGGYDPIEEADPLKDDLPGISQNPPALTRSVKSETSPSGASS